MRFVGILFYPPHHTDADLEEEVKWNGDEDERHKVGRRDDGRHKHDDDEGVFAVLGEHGRRDKAHLCQDEGDDGQLKHEAHDERQRGEGRDVAVEGDGRVYPLGHRVGAEEAERDREKHVVAHQHAEDEEHVDHSRHLHGILLLVFVERGRDEAEEFEEDVGRSTQQPQIDGGGDVGHE